MTLAFVVGHLVRHFFFLIAHVALLLFHYLALSKVGHYWLCWESPHHTYYFERHILNLTTYFFL